MATSTERWRRALTPHACTAAKASPQRGLSFCCQEMTEIVRAIYDMMGKYTYPALKGDVPQQHVDAFFQVRLWSTGPNAMILFNMFYHNIPVCKC